MYIIASGGLIFPRVSRDKNILHHIRNVFLFMKKTDPSSSLIAIPLPISVNFKACLDLTLHVQCTQRGHDVSLPSSSAVTTRRIIILIEHIKLKRLFNHLYIDDHLHRFTGQFLNSKILSGSPQSLATFILRKILYFHIMVCKFFTCTHFNETRFFHH